ncbi:MAG TPA: xylose isomerase, partial [Chloroflexia bacterium]|nr:xylose isomerase [Chloroflexia bacterium]
MSLPDLRPQAKRRTPDELVKHLKSFELDLKFSAGVWFFSPPASRFHDRYAPVIEIAPRLEIAAT